MRRFVLTGLAVAGLIACLGAPFASSFPDGLERVAERFGFMHLGEGEPVVSAPVPDYEVPGVEGPRARVSLAGIAGVLVAFGAAYGMAWAMRRIGIASRIRR